MESIEEKYRKLEKAHIQHKWETKRKLKALRALDVTEAVFTFDQFLDFYGIVGKAFMDIARVDTVKLQIRLKTDDVVLDVIEGGGV